MNIHRSFIFAAISIMFLTACHSQKNDTPQKQEMQNNTETANNSSEQIDFAMSDINGNIVSVKEEFAKHPVTIIDFWASWCGPCRQEMPNLVNIYNKYKNHGLGVIGVSLDEDESQWKNAVEEMNMSWLQLSDLQGWDNSAVQMYGIQGIPFTIIVDKSGNVINAGLRGEDLERFINEYLNNISK